MTKPVEHRAAPPEPPQPSRALQRELEAKAEVRRQGERVERRGMVRGLLLLAVVVLLASFWRAGFERVFLPGWWRHW